MDEVYYSKLIEKIPMENKKSFLIKQINKKSGEVNMLNIIHFSIGSAEIDCKDLAYAFPGSKFVVCKNDAKRNEIDKKTEEAL